MTTSKGPSSPAARWQRWRTRLAGTDVALGTLAVAVAVAVTLHLHPRGAGHPAAPPAASFSQRIPQAVEHALTTASALAQQQAQAAQGDTT
jgi:hypothetical protein